MEIALEVSLAKVRLCYATEGANLAEGGGLAVHERSASAFILAGFEIEDIQCVCLILIHYHQLTSPLEG